MKLKGNEKGLKTTTWIFNILFVIIMLFPLLFIISYSIKDSTAVYNFPPKLLPDPSKSISIIVDYSKLADENSDELKDKLLKDSSLAMYTTVMELNKETLGEVKFYGTIDGKTIYYQRAHTARLKMELDYGIYKNVFMMDRERIFYKDRYKDSAEKLGYEFDLAGLNRKYDAGAIGKNDLNDMVTGELIDENSDRGFFGEYKGTIVSINNLLLLENYKYYAMAPSYMYYDIPKIAKYSFFAFFFNTVLVIGWALITQVGLCSLTAYSLSRLFSRRMSNMLMLYFLGTLMVPFICILIPQALLMKSIGAMNNYGAMLLPYLCPAAFFIFLFKGFFDRLPQDLLDAAKIDGASEIYVYGRIAIPLSKSIIAVIALNVFVNAWNDFFWYLYAANTHSLWTINLALYNISMNTTTKQNVIFGLSFMTILPVIILSLVFSKQIKASLVGAAIKG